MSTAELNALEQQRNRRKRINRMKSTIVMTIAIWMIFSLLAIIILSVSAVRLNKKVKSLEVQVAAMHDNSSVESSDGQKTVASTVNVVTGIDTDENMAAEGDEHFVYLTFDSELSSNTWELLDELKENNIKATFFVSGSEAEDAGALLQRIVEDGHTLGMHSYSNLYSTLYASTDSFSSDLTEISDYIFNLTGQRSSYYRFPGGSGNEISNVDMSEFVKILNGNNISYFDWNVSAGDAAADYTVDDVVENIREGVEKYKTSVVLLHDAADKTTTVDAIDSLVETLNSMGANVLPIDESTAHIQYIKADSVE